MAWLKTLSRLQEEGTPVVLVTIASVRGHAPRGAGSKMLVTESETRGSVGGGNLEQTAILKSRELLSQPDACPALVTVTLNPTSGEHGVQCCGGKVTMLLEPFTGSRPVVAIFGAGHVGWALVHVLATLPIDIKLVDSRTAQLDEARLPQPRQASIALRHSPAVESIVPELPQASHLVILSHDHAEDLAVLDVALRRNDLGYLGLIGSKVKWTHFQARLLEEGHEKASLARVTTPIGLPEVPGKSPQAIAIATAAQLLEHLDLAEEGF